MVFTTTNLFKGIACPAGSSCKLTNCIYSHDLAPAGDLALSSHSASNATTTEPPNKRRRVLDDPAKESPTIARDTVIKPNVDSRSGMGSSLPDHLTPASFKQPVQRPHTSLSLDFQSVSKPEANAVAIQKGDKEKVVTTTSIKPNAQKAKISLNPCLIPNDPTGHARRTVFLKLLFAEMTRLNGQMKLQSNAKKIDSSSTDSSLILSNDELTTLAVDEEEKIARTQASVYSNVIKNRIGAYKKMTVLAWLEHLISTMAPPKREEAKPDLPKKAIDTSLSQDEELVILSRMIISDQKPLAAFGYIVSPPTQEEAEEAAAAVIASRNFEVCDRCTARFQVFPNRNKEGEMTTNGPCHYHPYRRVTPGRGKEDRYRSGVAGSGVQGAYYPCCGHAVGTKGCTESQHHVFKTSSPARLAAVFPFVNTPANSNPSAGAGEHPIRAITFDCEMCYTTLGMELIRLSAVAWPSAQEVVDVLVKPLGLMLDFNTRFSGVTKEQLLQAIPWSASTSPVDETQENPKTSEPLMFVKGPGQARDILCSFLTPSTPLIGHAIENDLNALRLCHPTIVDTVVLFPHARGLPFRHGLRILASKYLERSIQKSGEQGHDSREDSIATGDLVRVKVQDEWKLLRAKGWKLDSGRLVPPVSAEPPA